MIPHFKSLLKLRIIAQTSGIYIHSIYCIITIPVSGLGGQGVRIRQEGGARRLACVQVRVFREATGSSIPWLGWASTWQCFLHKPLHLPSRRYQKTTSALPVELHQRILSSYPNRWLSWSCYGSPKRTRSGTKEDFLYLSLNSDILRNLLPSTRYKPAI